jgi:hypothetical protein
MRPFRQLIVCGYPRGGTSLLYNMLSSSLPSFVFADFEKPALQAIETRGFYASKWPMDILNIKRVVANNILSKEIIVIVVIRDLRDVITSVHPNAPGRYFCSYETRLSPRGNYPYEIVDTDQGIRTIHSAIVSVRDMSGIRLATVKYEDLIADPDRVQKILSQDLGLEFCADFADFHTRGEAHAYRYAGAMRPLDANLVRENSPVDASRIGKWRRPEHSERIRSEFSTHPELFDLLIFYGYERNRDWFEPYRKDLAQ